MRRSWNILQRVDVGSACVDRGQFPLMYWLHFTVSPRIKI